MENIEMGRFIARLRKEKGLTQAELAGQLNLTDKAVSKWERGLSAPDIGTLEPLAGALGVSVAELLHGERMEPMVPISQVDGLVAEVARYQGELHRQRVLRGIALVVLGLILVGLALAGYLNRNLLPLLLISRANTDGPTAVFVTGGRGEFAQIAMLATGVVGVFLVRLGILTAASE